MSHNGSSVAHAELDVDARFLAGRQMHAFAPDRLESGELDIDAILTRREAGGGVDAVVGGDDGAMKARAGLGERHAGAANACSRRVSHHPGDLTSRRLRVGGPDAGQEDIQEDQKHAPHHPETRSLDRIEPMIQIDYNRAEMITRVRRGALAWLLALATSASVRAAAQELRVAAASDLQAALPAIAAQFEKNTGEHVAVTLGSSGNFATQIENGAPFDVFMSADIEYPKRLEQAGLAERGSLYQYATGRLVMWTRKDSGVDVKRGLAALTDARVRRIAIANPAHAPYGRAAIAAIRHEGLYDRVQSKFVLGENISQTAQFVHSGNADVGLIALALALGPALTNAGVYIEVPPAFYPPIEQAVIVVASSKQKAAASRFVESLKRPDAKRILQSFGFAVH